MKCTVPERDNLKYLMKMRGIKDNDLSEATGVPMTTIYRMKIGYTADPRLSTMKAVADYFGVTLGQIIGEEPLNLDLLHPDKGVTKVPVVNWEQIATWETVSKEKSLPWVLIENAASRKLFALRVNSDEYGEKFPRQALLLVESTETNVYPQYVIVQNKMTQYCMLAKRMRSVSGDCFVHPQNAAMIIPVDIKKHQTMGVVVGVRIDLNESLLIN